MYNEIYNKVRLFCLVGILSILTFSCEDNRVGEPLEENIEMWVNGSEFNVREYYESITTYGASEVQEDGSIKKIFVLHFQREDGRITPEKEHYALIMYDNNGQDNGQLIDTKLYLGGTEMDSLLLQTTSGRITLEIVGLSDYAEFAQGSIEKYEDDKDFEDEVKALQSIVKQYCDNYTEGLKDLEFGVFFIRDSYFEDYITCSVIVCFLYFYLFLSFLKFR